MAKKLVEFVPNFSEGRDKAKVEKIVDEPRQDFRAEDPGLFQRP